MEWAKNQYQRQYDRWVPWLEDIYLRYFTRDNKASYMAKSNLDKTKVTGISQVDAAQDKVHGTATSTLLGQDSVAAPVADLASREGINRIERRGKDEQGNYVPFAAPGESYAEGAGQKVGEGLKGATTMMPRIGIGKKQ